MSRIDKLKTLLARVEQRRAEPRLVAVSGGHAVSSANTNVAAQAARLREAPLEAAARPAAAPTVSRELDEESFTLPSSMPPPAMPARDVAKLGTSTNRTHEEQLRASSLPPPARTPLPPPAPSSTVPPSAQPAHLTDAQARSSTEVLPAVPTRIAPAPALPFDSAVKVTSSPRLDTVKTFGELLEQSLALRPKSG